MKPWAVFQGDDDPGGGGGHWLGDDADLKTFVEEKGYKTPADVVKAHKELTSLQDWVGKKGYKDAASVATAYREMEKKQGTMVSIPDGKASDEDYEKFAAKVRPRNAGEYNISPPDGLPEDVYDSAFAERIAAKALARGIPKRMFDGLFQDYLSEIGADITQLDAKAAEVKAEDEKTMRLKWGTEYDANIALADRALEKTNLKELFSQFGIATHPLVQVAFQQMAGYLEEMKPPDGKGGAPGGEEDQWFTEYEGVGPKKTA
jgi:hypothetical protein